MNNDDRSFLRSLNIEPCDFPEPEPHEFGDPAEIVQMSRASFNMLMGANQMLSDALDAERCKIHPAQWMWAALLAAFVAGILAARSGN